MSSFLVALFELCYYNCIRDYCIFWSVGCKGEIMTDRLLSFKNRMLYLYVFSWDKAVIREMVGDSLLADEHLKNADMARENYAVVTKGKDIDAELYELYAKSGGHNVVYIGGSYLPSACFKSLLPRFEEKFRGKSLSEIRQSRDSKELTREDVQSILDVYDYIYDSVSDEGYKIWMPSETTEKGNSEESENGEQHKRKGYVEDFQWLDQYRDADNMVTPEILDYSLVGTIRDVKNIHHDSSLGKSKLVLLLDVGGQNILVNARGAMHNSYGYITESRVAKLKASLPKENIDVSDEQALVEWFKEAGVEKSPYMKRREKARMASAVLDHIEEKAEENSLDLSEKY